MCRAEITGLMLVYSSTGDWIALYRDGRLVDQGHSFQEDKLLSLLGIEHEAKYDVDLEPGWLFPPTYAELEAALAASRPCLHCNGSGHDRSQLPCRFCGGTGRGTNQDADHQ